MSNADDRAEITRLIEEQDAAWRADDAVAFSRRVASDAVFTNIFGQQFVGRDAFQAQHAAIFSTIYAGSRLTQAIGHLRFAAEGVALVDTDAQVEHGKSLPPWLQSGDGMLRTRLLQVLLKVDGDWRISAFHGDWRISAFHNVAVSAAPQG